VELAVIAYIGIAAFFSAMAAREPSPVDDRPQLLLAILAWPVSLVVVLAALLDMLPHPTHLSTSRFE
jgi:hypothetical protein